MSIDWSKQKLYIEEKADKAFKDFSYIDDFLKSLISNYIMDIGSFCCEIEEDLTLAGEYQEVIDPYTNKTKKIFKDEDLEWFEELLTRLEATKNSISDGEIEDTKEKLKLISRICEDYAADTSFYNEYKTEKLKNAGVDKSEIKESTVLVKHTASTLKVIKAKADKILKKQSKSHK